MYGESSLDIKHVGYHLFSTETINNVLLYMRHRPKIYRISQLFLYSFMCHLLVLKYCVREERKC